MRRRGNKHGAVKTVVHGITFASKAEARRYQDLLLQGAAGYLTDLELQPRFSLSVRGFHVCDYVADFAYTLVQGEWPSAMLAKCQGPPFRIVEDVKSSWTRTLPVYRIKKKLMRAIHGIDIYEYGA